MTTSLTRLDIGTFLDKLASDEPAPGGGSASALAAAVAAALVEMVARLTTGREQFASSEADMKAVIKTAPALRRELLNLVDKDTDAYSAVMAAMRLPKATDEDKAARREAMQRATVRATEVPLRVATLAAEVLALARVVAESGNPNAITDAGVAGRLALAGAEGAGLNVRVNLPGIKDEPYKARVGDELDRVLALARETAGQVAAAVERRLGG